MLMLYLTKVAYPSVYGQWRRLFCNWTTGKLYTGPTQRNFLQRGGDKGGAMLIQAFCISAMYPKLMKTKSFN
jgi:hypothetical protein